MWSAAHHKYIRTVKSNEVTSACTCSTDGEINEQTFSVAKRLKITLGRPRSRWKNKVEVCGYVCVVRIEPVPDKFDWKADDFLTSLSATKYSNKTPDHGDRYAITFN
jgi:hypothetical protein